MKRIFGLLIVFVAVFNSMACEITFTNEGNAKASYKNGDIIVMKMTMVLTHRNCPEGLEATKYEYPGFKVLGATKWVEVKPSVYERKFKLQVDNNGSGKSSFSAVRTCDKEGAASEFKIKVE